MSRPQTGRRLDLAGGACRYLQEAFSTSPLRLHPTVGLVNHNRLRLYQGIYRHPRVLGRDRSNKIIVAAITSDYLSYK